MTATQNIEPHVSIAVYRPRPGCEAALDEVVRQQFPLLVREGFVTDDPATRVRARDGTIIEVFTWKSTAALEQAHHNAAVRELWERMDGLCDYVPLASIDECQGLFAGFRKFE